MEAEHVNETISEIGNPKSEAKLTGIQEVVFQVDQEIIANRKAIDERRGVVSAAQQIANRVRQEIDKIAGLVHAEELDHEEGKIRSEQTKAIVGVIDEIARNNSGDLTTLIGKLQGLERANELAASRFDAEVLKNERRARMDAEDAEDDLRAEPKAPVAKKPATRKSKKKTSKKRRKG